MSQMTPEHKTGPACDEPESSCAHRQRCIQIRWLLGGALFGSLFPLIGWLVAGGGHTFDAIAAAHRDQEVLYIVDLAPLVLGIAGLGIGAFHSRLIRIRHSIEQTVSERTAALEQANRDLSATQAEKDRFVASVSHELRTPLTSVVGIAHTLTETDGDFPETERDELLHLIVRESEEVASIVEDLLVAARVESGELAIVPKPIRLDEEMCAIAVVCDVAVTPRRVEPVTVMADPIRIHQILRNLITNADRYGGERITVDVYTNRCNAVLAVSDDGPGVPEDEVDLIFTAFGKAHHDPSRTESVGLGLTVSRNLAQLMGGDVVYRRRGDWTTFELLLPIVKSVPSEDAVPVAPAAGNKESVSYAH